MSLDPAAASHSHPPDISARGLWKVAWPIMISRMSQAVVGLCDTQMVSSLGTSAVAAASTGAMNSFSILIFPMAMIFLVSSFSSQMYGKGDAAGARRFGWYGLFLAMVTQVFCTGMILAVPVVLGWLPLTPEVRELMIGYMVIRMLSGGAAIGIEAMANYFGGMGQTRPGMVANMSLMVLNIMGNWMLIDGHWGCPALGVRGAAWASTLSTWVAFLGLFVYFLWHGRKLPPTRWIWTEFWRLVKFGFPAGVNWFLEIFAFIYFTNGVIGTLGTPTLAAMNVVFSLNSVSFMPAFGLASGGAILVGQAIGSGMRDSVPRAVALTAAATLLWQGATGVVYLSWPTWLISHFATGQGGSQMMEIGIRMLMVSSAWQLVDAVATTLAESLRAAGDTTFPMIARLVIAWVVFVPGATICVRYFHWGDAAATSWIVAYLALLAAALLWRFRTGAWRSIQLLEQNASA